MARWTGFGVAALALVFLLAAALRAAAAFHELWLDEVWSVLFAAELGSPLDVFTLHNDSTHYLNTLYVRQLGLGAPFPLYRLPALLCGAALPVAMTAWARRRDPLAAGAVAGLAVLSFPLTQYSAEARGYSPMLLLGFLSVAVMGRYLERPGVRDAALFGVCAVGALLWQLTYAHLYLALLLWSGTALIRRRGPAGAARPLLLCHAAPLVCLAVLYVVDVSQLHIAGGPQRRLPDEIARGLALSLGLPERGPAALAGAALGVGAAGWSWLRLRRRDPELAVLFAGVLAVAPALWLAVFRPDFLHYRYFLVGLPFLLLLWADALAHGWRSGAAGRGLVTLCALVYAIGSALHVGRLVAEGRGTYQAPLRYVAEQTAGQRVTLTSDQDFQTARLLEFYLARIGTEKTFEYRLRDSAPSDPPEWILTRAGGPAGEPPPALELGGRAYAREWGPALRGAHWALYRRAD